MGAGDAYDAVAEQYAAMFGTVDQTAAADRVRIGAWAASTRGDVLDAGCGPGQWTAFVSERQRSAAAADGATGAVRRVVGTDASEGLLDLAERHYGDVPGVEFGHGDLRSLPFEDGSFGGALAWYSLIHLDPHELPTALAQLHRVLRPGGSLLVGCFDGPAREPFDHRVAQAWFWNAEALSDELADSGFDVLAVEHRADPGVRPHLAIEARRPALPAPVNAP